LNLEFNNIEQLPLNFNELVSIEVLSLKHNHIAALPNLSSLQSLEDLNCSENAIKVRPVFSELLS